MCPVCRTSDYYCWTQCTAGCAEVEGTLCYCKWARICIRTAMSLGHTPLREQRVRVRVCAFVSTLCMTCTGIKIWWVNQGMWLDQSHMPMHICSIQKTVYPSHIAHHVLWRALLLPPVLLLLEDAWLVEATVRDLTFFLELPTPVLTLVLLPVVVLVTLAVPPLLVMDPVLWATLLLDREPCNLVMDCNDSATYCCSSVDM